MSDVGKITEIEPEDGLGWIEMPDGARVRFGGTACKGFVPTIGMSVQVLGTKAGYGGTVKATELKEVRTGGALGMQPVKKAGAPRTSLHTVQSSGVRADDVLLQLLGLADVSDPVHADLKALNFSVATGASIACKNPWFFLIAVDPRGTAYGLYTHPMVAEHPQAPWVAWDKSTDHVRSLAPHTSALLQGLLLGSSDVVLSARAKETFLKLGMPDEPGAALQPGPAAWLPPEDDTLRPLAEYLGESDGAEMERGLLAYASRKASQEAQDALQGLYDAWEWVPPKR